MTSPLVVKDLIKLYSKKYNIPYSQMEEIVYSPFKLTAVKLREASIDDLDTLPYIHIINFGKFVPSLGKIKRALDIVNSRKDEVV